MLTRTIKPKLPVDLALTLGPLMRGPHDPTMHIEARGAWWRATRTPEGAALTRFEACNADGEIRAQAWGPGAAWAIEAAPDLLGAQDSLDGFAPQGKLAEVHRQNAGLRISRSRAVFEALVPTVLEQLVSGVEAHTSFRKMVHAWSEPAPDPAGGSPAAALRMPPQSEVLAKKTYWELHPFGIERKRAITLFAVAARASRLEEALSMPHDAARKRLLAISGVGPWTAASVALLALGDPDAVPLGDYNLPHAVSYAFTGEPRGTDDRMLELLAPYAGHRGRVIRLLYAAGITAPRFGPRRRIRNI